MGSNEPTLRAWGASRWSLSSLGRIRVSVFPVPLGTDLPPVALLGVVGIWGNQRQLPAPESILHFLFRLLLLGHSHLLRNELRVKVLLLHHRYREVLQLIRELRSAHVYLMPVTHLLNKRRRVRVKPGRSLPFSQRVFALDWSATSLNVATVFDQEGLLAWPLQSRRFQLLKIMIVKIFIGPFLFKRGI